MCEIIWLWNFYVWLVVKLRFVFVGGLALGALSMLAACGPEGKPSIEGECQLIAPPGRNICGATAADQAWIDQAITRYGAACRWESHPSKPCVQIKVEIDPTKLPPAKKKLLDRIMGK